MLQDNMEYIGWEIISVSTNKTKNNACICGESSCGQLSRWFAALNDARGCKLVMPAIGGTNNPERKQFKIERCCHHLGLGKSNAAEYASIDNRKDAKKAAQTRNNKSNFTKQRVKVIAAHHFHPAVVQELVVSGVIQFKDYLDESFVKTAGLLESGEYTAADMFKEKIDGKKVYTPVPSYKRALDDYKHAATHFQLMDVIKGCRDSIYGHSFKKRNEDDVAMPVDKMPRRSMENKEDLQRTVCILAEKVERMHLRNKQLSKQLQEEMERNHNLLEKLAR
jgi:hypothetical protein